MSLALPADLSSEERMLVELVDRLAAEVVAPVASTIDHDGEIPAGLIDALSSHGLLGVGVPELAGEDVDPVWGPLVVSRLARVSASVGSLVASVHEGAAAFGERSRLRGRPPGWVPTVVLAGVAGSHDDRGFVIHGRLRRIELGGTEAGSLLVAVCGDGDDCVVLELDPSAAGIVVGDREPTTGLRGRRVAPLSLDAVRASASDVVGGAPDAERALLMRDLMTAALALGVSLAALEAADRYASERRQFGAELRAFPAVRGHLLEMEQRVATVSALLWAVARDALAGRTGRAPTLRAARAGLQALQSVPRLAVQVLGGYGYMDEYPVEVRLRDGVSIAARAGGLEALSVAAGQLAVVR